MPDKENKSLPFVVREMLAFENATAFGLSVDLVSKNVNTFVLSGYTKESPFSLGFDSIGDGTIETFNFNLSDLPAAITLSCPSAVLTKGEVFATIYLTLNSNRVQMLTRGYVQIFGGPTWPQPSGEDNMPGINTLQQFASANPAAGAECTFTVASRTFIRLQSVQVTLVTSSTAANRRVHLVINNGNNSVNENYFGNVNHTASLTRVYSFVPIGASLAESDDNDLVIPIPQNILLLPGSKITTETTNIQVGDDFGVMNIMGEIFLGK